MKKSIAIIISFLVLLFVTTSSIYFLNLQKVKHYSTFSPEDPMIESPIQNKNEKKNIENKESSVPQTSEEQDPIEEPSIKKDERSSNKEETSHIQPNNIVPSPPNTGDNLKEESKAPIVDTPKCTPKKFDFNWVRADFSSFNECTSLGDQYKNIGYGYFCDSFQDDCKVTYYMLTLFERNTGKEHDFHEIKLP